MRKEQQYVVELASTVNGLFAKGVKDPNAFEIAAEHFPSKILGGEIAEGIRKRLHKIRNVLEEDFQLPVCLLSSTYYARFRHNPVVTMDDARRCLPFGNTKRAEGIYLQSGADDPIWQAMVELGANTGAGKVKKSFNRTLRAVENGRLTERRAGEMLIGTKRRLIPDKPELEERAIKALEEGIKDEAQELGPVS